MKLLKQILGQKSEQCVFGGSNVVVGEAGVGMLVAWHVRGYHMVWHYSSMASSLTLVAGEPVGVAAAHGGRKCELPSSTPVPEEQLVFDGRVGGCRRSQSVDRVSPRCLSGKKRVSKYTEKVGSCLLWESNSNKDQNQDQKKALSVFLVNKKKKQRLESTGCMLIITKDLRLTDNTHERLRCLT